jgi:hypothetical protein
MTITYLTVTTIMSDHAMSESTPSTLSGVMAPSASKHCLTV